MKNLNRFQMFVIGLLALCCVPALWGLFHSGFFVSDDGNWMVIRLSAFYEMMRAGQLPVLFLLRLNHGYGYPVADFLYPLFLYLGAVIHVLGFSFVNTVKIILGLSVVGSGIFTYLWLRKIFSWKSAFVASLIYVYFPYHLLDIYQRGSVGEVLALCIVPFIFWQIERRAMVWAGVGLGLLIMSHNSLAFIFLPVIFLYMWLVTRFSW